MTNKELGEFVKLYCGGLTKTEKMPGLATALPAGTCWRGSKLRKVEGTICSHCYACKGRFVFESVQQAMWRQFYALGNALGDPWYYARYRDYMALAINRDGRDFRHFVSGDFQEPNHVGLVCDIARMTPTIKHWASTRELQMIRDYLNKGGVIPANMCLRISDDWPDQDGRPTTALPRALVSTDKGRVTCPVGLDKERKSCGECRMCWDRSVDLVTFGLH